MSSFSQWLQPKERQRSKTPPDDFAEDVDFEMANLGEDATNVPGTIFISSQLGSHGARVKWYPVKPNRRAPCVVVSIGPSPQVLEDFVGTPASRRTAKDVIAWVVLNQVELLDFWNNGETWDFSRVAAFIAGLKKI